MKDSSSIDRSFKYPLVSIIVVNYNGSQYIADCLDSVLASSYRSFEIIFVDNASSDDSLSIVSSFEKRAENHQLIVVRNSSNLGFSKGNNIGAAYARGNYLVFLNNDTMVEPNWLEELIKAIAGNERIGAAQSKLLALNNPERIFDSAGDFVDFYGTSLSRATGEKDFGQYETVEEVFSARGACMIVRYAVLKEIGGFDPAFVLGYEDIDLCWRIRLRGYKVVYVPQSVVFHKGYGTSSHLREVRRDPRPLLMAKNYSTHNLLLYLPPYLIVTLGGFFIDVFAERMSGSRASAFGRFNAMRWVLANLRSVLVKRYVVQRMIRRVSDKTMKKMMLQPNLAIYTRFLLEGHRAVNAPKRFEKLLSSYYRDTNPYRLDKK